MHNVNMANQTIHNGNVHNSISNGYQSDVLSNGHNSDTSIPSPTNDTYKVSSNSLSFKREIIDSEGSQF